MEEEVVRVRMPREGEVLGQVIEMLGSGRMRVDCEDGKIRMCRVPGRIKKRVWVKLGDIVVVKPWSVQSDEKGDIVWRYTRTQVGWLKRQGRLKGFDFSR